MVQKERTRRKKKGRRVCLCVGRERMGLLGRGFIIAL